MEGDLLGLGEEVVGVAVQHHPPDAPDGNQLLGDQLGRVEDVEAELCSSFSSTIWRPNSHSRKSPRSIDSNRSRRLKSGSLPAIFCASSQTSEWTPWIGFQWNLTKRRLAFGVDEPKGVDAEAFHHGEAAR